MPDSPQISLFPPLIGQRFGSRVVIELIPKTGTKQKVLCRCSCGKVDPVRLIALTSGRANSCKSCRSSTHRATVHGPSPEYTTWINIKSRCCDTKATAYPRYGGRGVKVAPEWLHDFEAFLRDVGPRPSPNHSIDRHPDSDGDYRPGNVRWATRTEQNRNRSCCRYLEYDGLRLTLAEWAERQGIPWNTLDTRLSRGWSVERALLTPSRASSAKITDPDPCLLDKSHTDPSESRLKDVG